MTEAAALPLSIADRRRWLTRLAREARREGRRAALFTVADLVGAVAFAGGLALAFSSAPISGAGLALAGATVRGLLGRLAAGAGAAASRRVRSGLRRQAVEPLLLARPGARRSVGEALAVAVDGVEAMDGHLARFVPAQTAARLTPLLAAGLMALASPISAAIVLLTFVPFVAGMALAGGAAETAARAQFQALSRLSGLFADRARQAPLIQAFQAEAATTQRLAAASENLALRTLAILRIAFLSSAVMEFFAALSVALVAVYCGFSLLHLLPFRVPEQLSLARAVFVLALAPEAYLPMRRLSAAYHDRQKADAAAGALIPLVSAEPPAQRRPLDAPPAVDFDAATVIHDDADHPALDGLTLHLEPGESVALVGPSGSGKSTALALLLGLVAPASGAVRIDGREVAEGAPLAAYAGQAPVVIPASLRDNIALARRDASLADIVDAARKAGLLNAPGGLERRIDERGGGLSGGERRRLALARALLSRSPLLLLDEPTANLDPVAETALLPVIAEAMRGRTTLLVTHSERTAALADRVMRLAA